MLAGFCNECGDELLSWAENEDGICACCADPDLTKCTHCGELFNDHDGDATCDDCLDNG